MAEVKVSEIIPDSFPKLITTVMVACKESNRFTAAKGIWDTGVSNCTISSAMAGMLGMDRLKESVTVTSINGATEHKRYKGLISLDCESLMPAVFTECDTLGDDVVIIGLDVIRQGELRIRPTTHGIALSFSMPPE